MTEVRRPAPPLPKRERWRQLWRARRAPALQPRLEQLRSGPGAGVAPGVVTGALLSLGAVLILVAGGVVWTSWKGRSTVPLDDQLPYLLGTDPELDTTEPPHEEPGTPELATAEPVNPTEPNAPSAADSPGVQMQADAVDAPEGSSGRSLVVVYVSGAVAVPGVVELEAAVDDGARVHHAVAAAGGATDLADLERVNLAALLVDGERIHVPEIGDDALPQIVAPNRSAVPAAGTEAQPGETAVSVDINRASVVELEELPGIGPSIARSILDLRTARGAYASVDELLLVDGIGPAKLETLRPHAFVGTG